MEHCIDMDQVNSITLSNHELIELTQKVRYKAQCSVLASLGVPFKIRKDGTPVVLRSSLEATLGNAPKNQKQATPSLRLPKARSILAS